MMKVNLRVTIHTTENNNSGFIVSKQGFLYLAVPPITFTKYLDTTLKKPEHKAKSPSHFLIGYPYYI